ncbi:MAG: ferrous iron transport protein B [Anaerolineae bacterium]|nr:ferrous iron transport protein B [Anaerolineae bacterium]
MHGHHRHYHTEGPHRGLSHGERGADDQREAADTIVVALAGQPNVGKSTIFNLLTGLTQHVGNWPGKTVEQKTGHYEHNGRDLLLVDLPGTYSLSANSVEERIARDYIIQESPDVVVAVVDAAIPERSLYLLAELLLLPAPVVLVLNMMDVAEQEGIQIEPQVLQAALGIPVVPMIATRSEGVARMLDAILSIVDGTFVYEPRRPTILPAHQEVLANLITLIANYVPSGYPVPWIALKLLEGDEEILTRMEALLPPEVDHELRELLYHHEDAVLDVAGARYEWIGRMVRAAVVRPKVGQVSLTSRLDAVFTHPIWGIVALGAVLAGVFALTYAIANPIQSWLDQLLGQFIDGARSWLAMAGVAAWFADLIAGGLLGGAGMVVTFAPILIVFFATLGFLEDTGYMARAAYVTDRFMHMMGLHGKSFMPLLLGFGCNVPAVLGSRIVESQRARLLTILLAPLVPCSAQLAVVTILAAALFGNAAGLIVWSLVALNLVVLAALGVLLNRFLVKGEPAVFIMELPLYHLPNLRTIGLYVWQNLVAFLQKAGSVILIASVVVWFLSYFPAAGDVSQSYLAIAGRAIEPVGRLMGLPWPILVALLTSFVAKENTIATLGVLYGDVEAVLPTLLTLPAGLAFLVVQMLFVPCLATVAAMKQESHSWKWTLVGVAILLVISLAAGIAVYQLGSLL